MGWTTEEEREFWERAFCAALAGGSGVTCAREAADAALSTWRKKMMDSSIRTSIDRSPR